MQSGPFLIGNLRYDPHNSQRTECVDLEMQCNLILYQSHA